jgi:hypothetical protein
MLIVEAYCLAARWLRSILSEVNIDVLSLGCIIHVGMHTRSLSDTLIGYCSSCSTISTLPDSHARCNSDFPCCIMTLIQWIDEPTSMVVCVCVCVCVCTSSHTSACASEMNHCNMVLLFSVQAVCNSRGTASYMVIRNNGTQYQAQYNDCVEHTGETRS